MSTKRCSEGQECKPRLCRKPLAMRRIFCSLAPGRRHAFFFLFLRGGVTARIFPSLPSGGERRVRRAVGTGSWQSYRPLRSPLPLARARGEQNAAQERKRKASRQRGGQVRKQQAAAADRLSSRPAAAWSYVTPRSAQARARLKIGADEKDVARAGVHVVNAACRLSKNRERNSKTKAARPLGQAALAPSAAGTPLTTRSSRPS